MKIHKRIAILLAVTALLFCTVIHAFAAENIDPNRSVSLTISYQDNNIPIKGAEFSIFQVGTVDKQGNITATKQFSKYNVNIVDSNPDTWKSLALTLEGYALRDKLAPTDSAKTNERGLALFPNNKTKLSPGLYLVLSTRQTQNEMLYETTPFMVLMPMQDKGTDKWNYNVAVTPKYSSRSQFEVGTVDYKVLIIWEDEGHEHKRPINVDVQLLRDGEISDTVILNSEYEWRCKWSDLDIQYQWHVVQEVLEDYTVEITKEGSTFVITNTYIHKPEEPTEPQATSNPPASVDPSTPGDSVAPTKPISQEEITLPQTGQLWWPVPLLSVTGLFMIIFALVFFRGKKNEEK